MRSLKVMVVESSPHVADDAVDRLVEVGHRVYRCHEPDAAAFPCKAIGDAAACPLVEGVDVALVVNAGVDPAPSTFEDGATCALRAHVPLVEEGPINPSPLTPWVSARADGDVAEGVRLGVERDMETLRQAIWMKIGPVLATAEIDRADMDLRLARDSRDFRVHLLGPIAPSLVSTLAIRISDAVRDSGRRFPRLGIAVTPAEPHRA